MIDAHCHLEKNEYNNFSSLIDDIFKEDIELIITNGCDLPSNEEAIELSNKYQNIYAAIGFHPAFADKISDHDYCLLEEQIKNKKVIAIGEIGLDYYYNCNKDIQKRVFEKQLMIAQKYNIPVIVHNREATSDIYSLIKKYNVRGIIHCFNENKVWAQKFIDLGFLLGVNGIITFKNAETLREVIKDISLEYIVLETDAPFLTPAPFRGQKNSPLYLKYICQKLAEIKENTYYEVAKQTTANVKRLFDL